MVQRLSQPGQRSRLPQGLSWRPRAGGWPAPSPWTGAAVVATVAAAALTPGVAGETAVGGAGVANLHPLDGPDADIRIIIGNKSVTMNIGVNLVFMDDLVEVPRENPGDLHEVEAPLAGQRLFEYFRNDNIVAIDGMPVTPVFSEVIVDRSSLGMIPLFPRTGSRGVIKAAVVMEYPVKSAPQQVSIVWGSFPLDVDQSTAEHAFYREIQAQVVASGMSEIVRFTDLEPQYIWHAPAAGTKSDHLLAVPAPPAPETINWPLASMAVAGGWLVLALGGLTLAPRLRHGRGATALAATLPAAAVAAWAVIPVWNVETHSPFEQSRRLPTTQEALAIFQPLHTNIYRAFDYVDESDVYDALARSVDGPLLDTLYNQIYRSLIMQDQGGAVSRVETVTPVETEITSIGALPPDDRIGFSVLARWQVEGAVYHWGHSHRRTSEYLAEYNVVEAADGWRIAGNRVLEQKRIAAYDGGAAMPTPSGPSGGGGGIIANPFTTPPPTAAPADPDAASGNDDDDDDLLEDEI